MPKLSGGRQGILPSLAKRGVYRRHPQNPECIVEARRVKGKLVPWYIYTPLRKVQPSKLPDKFFAGYLWVKRNKKRTEKNQGEKSSVPLAPALEVTLFNRRRLRPTEARKLAELF
ncbi:MAG: hypothetical protein QW343_03430 [Candidatus Norongarragalinales archaeon]